MRIPLLDMAAQHESIKEELDEAIARVLAHRQFVGGPEVVAFEDAFADYCGARHCVGMSSGTDALTLTLRAAGVGRGDEVITSALTFIATAESIVEAGATPVLADPDYDSALLSAEAVEVAITERTAALVPVHLYGQPVDLDAFREVARRNGLLLVEDAAQAHGAAWNGARVGSNGHIATFSFFPGKNLGALGDAGGVVTSDSSLDARLRSLRDHGRADKYRHDELGTNARLDTLQAAVLAVKLPHLDRWNQARRAHATAYDTAFEQLPAIDPVRIDPAASPVYHQYVVRVGERDTALDSLRARGIGAGVHYPVPLHRQPALAAIADARDRPNADRLAARVLSLPVYPELSEEGRGLVIDALKEHAASAAPA